MVAITLYQMGTLQSVTLTESILVVVVVGSVVSQRIIVPVWGVLTTEMSQSGGMKVSVCFDMFMILIIMAKI